MLAAGDRAGRRLATALLLAGSVLWPWCATPQPLLRVSLAFVALLAFLNGTRLAVTSRRMPWRRRLWQLASLFDVDHVRPVSSHFSSRLLAGTAAHLILALLCLGALGALDGFEGPAQAAARLALGIFLLYGIVGFLSEVTRFVYRAIGLEVPQNQCAPALSRSAQEFWGSRWNRFVSHWLADLVFRPLARRRHAVLGILAAFLASATMHAWVALVPLGGGAALSMGLYFLVEGLVVVAEMPLRVHSWPEPVARAWTIIVVAGPSGLGIDPFLRTLGL